jgi:tousled-like kinase
MLFGKKPFGEDMSQESLLSTQTMRNALHVDFPSKPPVSADAKEFLRSCLAHNKHERPDLLSVFGQPYLAGHKK